jgi:hypothetical protein
MELSAQPGRGLGRQLGVVTAVKGQEAVRRRVEDQRSTRTGRQRGDRLDGIDVELSGVATVVVGHDERVRLVGLRSENGGIPPSLALVRSHAGAPAGAVAPTPTTRAVRPRLARRRAAGGRSGVACGEGGGAGDVTAEWTVPAAAPSAGGGLEALRESGKPMNRRCH